MTFIGSNPSNSQIPVFYDDPDNDWRASLAWAVYTTTEDSKKDDDDDDNDDEKVEPIVPCILEICGCRS